LASAVKCAMTFLWPNHQKETIFPKKAQLPEPESRPRTNPAIFRPKTRA